MSLAQASALFAAFSDSAQGRPSVAAAPRLTDARLAALSAADVPGRASARADLDRHPLAEAVRFTAGIVAALTVLGAFLLALHR